MIKARGKLGNQQNCVFIGLTHDQLRHLAGGMTINIDLEAVGLDGRVLIFGGPDDATMTAWLNDVARKEGVRRIDPSEPADVQLWPSQGDDSQ